MNAIFLLSLQMEWGADEALLPEPMSRLQTRPAEAPAREPDMRRHDPLPAAAPSATPGPSHPPAQPPAQGWSPRAPIAVTAARGPAAEARDAAAAAHDLDALRAAILGFGACSLRDTATHSVLPSGDPAAGIVIVGEVPDEDEDRAGHPFAGRAGDLLDRMLGSIRLSRADCLLLPLIPWRPPGGKQPTPVELNTCQPFLERALVLARPAFVLCMGSRPARTVAGSAIRAGASWRSPVVSGLPEGARALAMRHPSYLLSHLPARRDAWTDLIRLRRALDAREPLSSITDA
ncbi:uracil-DNA glycosylase [Acetobacteraceae bacterium KSS8]|uniref:Uracil-DNA glycosylase n=1 Tax=Endosaccharibacter trunci TaxID=2812733 RepID=A0ABT1W9T5_9PROT|nr:uracil-DNA glycosylase [Acetobacteraceae bacterium KSS8]